MHIDLWSEVERRLGIWRVCFGSLADINERITDVRFTPESGQSPD
jgi:hypothetical protein